MSSPLCALATDLFCVVVGVGGGGGGGGTKGSRDMEVEQR